MNMDTRTKILVIEDEELFAKSLGIVLREAGMEVLVAEDGERGLALARTKHPGIILLDNILPKMLGLEVLRKLKEDQGTRDIPVLMLTVLSDSDTISAAIAEGAVGYLIKSDYQLHEIVKKVQSILTRAYAT